ncbi:hypothetical protein ACWDQL_32500 [Streptomyces olivaceus]
MGPEGGAGGGLVVAEGTPEQVAGVPASHTGKFLRDVLGADRVSDAASVRSPRRAAKKTAVKKSAVKDTEAGATAAKTARTAATKKAAKPAAKKATRTSKA